MSNLRKPVPLPAAFTGRDWTPFVGREEQLQRLKAAWETATTGRTQLVLISGEPGIGKTRLAYELGARVHAEDGNVLVGRCEDEAVVAYQPFVEALRYFVGQCPTDVLKETPAEGLPELTRLVPELSRRLPELQQDGSQREGELYRVFEAARNLLSAAAPVLLIVDDLHWVDKPTVRLLRHLVRGQSQMRLLVLGLTREPELRADDSLLELFGDLRRDQAFQHIALPGLNSDEVRALIQTRLGRRPAGQLTQLVAAETEGNPFFAEELLSHLAETGMLDRLLDPQAAPIDPGVLGIPEGVRQLLRTRLSQLPASCYPLLEDAAVIGRQFDFALLSAVAGREEADCLQVMESCMAHGLLTELPGASGPRYAFSHGLTRETIYQGMSAARRQVLHLRTAEAIESLRGTTANGEIGAVALHYRLAGAPDWEKALDYSIRAGEAAAEAFAYEDAAAHFKHAVELMQAHGVDARPQASLLERLGDLMYISGIDYAAGVTYLEQALALYEELGDTRRAAQMHSRLGRDLTSYPATMNIPRALEHDQAAEKYLSAGPEGAALGYVYVGMTSIAVWTAQTDEGLRFARRAMEVGERIGNKAIWANGAAFAGYHLFAGGQVKAGLELANEAWEESVRSDLAVAGYLAAFILGYCYRFLGAPLEAQEVYRRELSQARVARSLVQRTSLLGDLGLAYVGAGDLAQARAIDAELGDSSPLAPLLATQAGEWERSEQLQRQELARARQTGNRGEVWGGSYRLGRLQWAQGHDRRAEELFETALAIDIGGPRPVHELWVRSDLAVLQATRGRLPEAETQVTRCREIAANGEDFRGITGRLAATEAVVAAAAKRLPEAETLFAEAIGTFERYSLALDKAEALHLWGRALAVSRRRIDRASAEEKLEQAIATYREHGAGERWVERVEADRARLVRRRAGSETKAVYPDGLSEREVEVLRLVTAGRSNQQIADDLVISVNTVLRHVSSIFTKTGVANRTEAAAYAHRVGLV